MSTAQTERPLRADAQRNRDKLLTVAVDAFAEHGIEASLEDIARRAGVGIGTLYRHFPTKEVLLQTVLREELLAWAGAAAQAAATDPDPWTALERFLEDALRRQAGHAAMCEHLATAMTAPDPACARELLPVIDGLVARCHADGRLAPDVTAGDVTLLLVSLGYAVRAANADDVHAWRRLLAVTLRGLAAPT